jgi:phage gpG-like protein
MGVKIISRPPDYAKLLGAGLAGTMKKASMYLQSSADKKINSGIMPGNAPLTQAVKQGGQSLRDRGELMKSIAPHSGELWADASTNLKYARIQQEGGTIRPKNAKASFIPTVDKASGKSTREFMRSYGAWSPRSLINAMKADGYGFFTAGRVFFAYKKSTGKTGRRGKEFVLFIISRSVKIPPRPFLYIDDKDETYLMKLIQEGFMNTLKGRK